MNGHYEWQKHQASEQPHIQMKETNANRQAKADNDHQSMRSLIKDVIPMLVGIIVVIGLLTGCQPTVNVQAAKTDTAVSTTTNTSTIKNDWTMEDRIQFQDKREVYLDWHQRTNTPMADRIRLHDQLWENSRYP